MKTTYNKTTHIVTEPDENRRPAVTPAPTNRGDDPVTDETYHQSSVKFFLIFFGLPILLIGILAWAMNCV